MRYRKILITDGMSGDFLLLLSNASEEDLYEYCKWHNKQMENGGNFEMFLPLKSKYYVELLLDSEINNRKELNELLDDDVEVYDLSFCK